jgi:hypothetical protein
MARKKAEKPPDPPELPEWLREIVDKYPTGKALALTYKTAPESPDDQDGEKDA